MHGKGEWAPPVVTCSGLHDIGVDDLWERVLAHREQLGADGLAEKRAQQQLDFTWALVRDELDQRLRLSGRVRRVRREVREPVLAGELPAPPPPTASSRRTTAPTMPSRDLTVD